MEVNRDAIFETRPWKVCGEGPALEHAAPLSDQGFNEGKGKPLTAADIRYTVKGDTPYAITMGKPGNTVVLKSLGTASLLLDKPVGIVHLLGSSDQLRRSESADALTIYLPSAANLSSDAVVFSIDLGLGH